MPRSYLGQTTADILHTTTVGPGTQLLDVCVTVPPRAAALPPGWLAQGSMP